jgi:hypothetical protein
MSGSAEETKTRRGGIGLPWVLVLMVGSFVGGAFVGLHPMWLPIPGLVTTGVTDDDKPANDVRPAVPSVAVKPAVDTTQSTQPSNQGQ